MILKEEAVKLEFYRARYTANARGCSIKNICVFNANRDVPTTYVGEALIEQSTRTGTVSSQNLQVGHV